MMMMMMICMARVARFTCFTCLLAAGILYFVSATVNPLLYNVLSRRYRAAFRDSFRRLCLGRRRTTSPPLRPGRRRFALAPTTADLAAVTPATTGGASTDSFPFPRIVPSRGGLAVDCPTAV